MITSEYITVIWAFCNHCIFSIAFVHTFPFSGRSAVSTEKRTMNTKHRKTWKFFIWFGRTPSLSLEMLQQVSGDNKMLHTRVFEWHKRFKEEREEVKYESGRGRLSTSKTEVNVEQIKQVVCGTRWLNRKIASQLDMKKDSVWKIITKEYQDCWMMIRRIVACRCVKISSNVFRLNQSCPVESSLVMRLGFWVQPGNEAPEQSAEVSSHHWGWRKLDKVKSQSHVDHDLQSDGLRPQ